MKEKKSMAVLAIVIVTLLFSLPMKAQITIGALTLPDPSAVLDLQSNGHYGMLLPRLALASTTDASVLAGGVHVAGMMVFNTATAGDVTPGTYCDDGTKWVKVGSEKWFYIPPFNLPVTTLGDNQTFNLYNQYARQFTKSDNTQFVSSNTSATEVQPVYTATQLDYYVTAFPTDCIKITSIDADGTMHFNVTSLNIPEGSFITVICVVK